MADNEDERNRDDDPLDLLLTSTLHADALPPPPPGVEQRLLERIDTFNPPSHRLRWPLTISGAIAAMLVVGVLIGLSLFGGGQQSLYAQVRAAAKNVTTIHVVSTEYRRDQPVLSRETWFQRGVGYHLRESAGDWERIDIQARDAAWLYEPGASIAARQAPYRSVDDLGALDLDDLVEIEQLFKHNPTRDPKSDKEVEGERWPCYSLQDDGTVVRVWLDADRRVREYEAHDDGRPRMTGRVEYDIPIDRKLFAFDPPEGVQVVEPRQFLAHSYRLEEALFKRETAGQVFAVHEVKRIDDKWAWMVCSSRLTDENHQALAIDRPFCYFGQIDALADWGRANHEPIGSPVDIGTARAGDITVRWYLLGARYHDRLERVGVLVMASAANELEDRLEDLGKPTRERFGLDLPVPEPPAGVSMDSWLREVHGNLRRLRPILPTSVFEVVPNPPKTNGRRESRDPRSFSVDRFIANMRKRIERWPDNGSW